MRVLTVNAGSSSLKVAIVRDGQVESSADQLPERPPQVDAVGHRIVHGGLRFTAPVVVDAEVEQALRALTDLAPLHQPKSLDALHRARELLPAVPHVACFDTAFHATLPEAAATYALPRDWRERWPLRRFGFHGISVEWSTLRTRELVPDAARVVVCHLGAGSSVTAVLDGRSVDTTMGFTPLDGLVMATRSGAIDPGLITWLEEHEQVSPAEIAQALEHRSGLLGLGGSADMRVLLGRADADAKLAVDVYLRSLAKAIAAMTVPLGGLDALTFTGGIGEGSAEVRERTCLAIGHLGVRLDRRVNADAQPDCVVSSDASAAAVLVVAAREDLMIASAVQQTLGS